MRVRVRAFFYANAGARAGGRKCVGRARTCVSVRWCACPCVCVRECVRVWTCTSVRLSRRTCACAGVCAGMHACVRRRMHV